MKNVGKKTASEPNEETQTLLVYKEDLKEIKDLLKIIADRLSDLKLTGGF